MILEVYWLHFEWCFNTVNKSGQLLESFLMGIIWEPCSAGMGSTLPLTAGSTTSAWSLTGSPLPKVAGDATWNLESRVAPVAVQR